jgi:hypothetical protein
LIWQDLQPAECREVIRHRFRGGYREQMDDAIGFTDDASIGQLDAAL